MRTVLVKVAAEFRKLDADAFIASRRVSQVDRRRASVAASAPQCYTDLCGERVFTEVIGLGMVIKI